MNSKTDGKTARYLSILIVVTVIAVSILILFAPMPETQDTPAVGELEEALAIEVDTEIGDNEITFTSSQESVCRAENNVPKVLSFKDFPIAQNQNIWEVLGGNNIFFGMRREDARVVLSGDSRKVINFGSTSYAGIFGKQNLRRGDYKLTAEMSGIEFNSANNTQIRVGPLSPEEEQLDYFDNDKRFDAQNRPINPSVTNRYLLFRLSSSRYEDRGEFLVRLYVIPSSTNSVQGIDKNTVIADLVRIVNPGERRLISSTDVSRNSNIAAIVSDITNMGVKLEIEAVGENIYPTVSFRDLKLGNAVTDSTIWHTVKLAPRGIPYSTPSAVRNWGADMRNVLNTNVAVNNFKLTASGCLPQSFN